MSNTTNQLIINLAPDKLCAAIIRKGRVVQGEQIDLDPKEWSGLWADGLMPLDQPLRQIMSRFSSRSLPSATLIYQSPTVTQQVHSFDLSLVAATQAGIAKIRDGIGQNEPVQTCPLTESGKGIESNTILVFGEREDQLRSLYAWLNRCGIRSKSFVPTSIAMMSLTAKIAAQAEPETAVFYLGADVSVMAYATDTGLKLIRSAEIGYRKLIEGYIQALSGDSSDEMNTDKQNCDTESTLDNLDALTMLFEHGIPMNTSEVNGIELRSTVLPILAPVLQRFCIEVKQTFRYGLQNEKMPKNLMVTGPGASIPMINRALSQHIEMHNTVDPAAEGYDPSDSLGRGSVVRSLIESKSCPDGLLPEIAHEASTRSLLTRCLVTGAAVAAIVMGSEYAMTTHESQRIQQLINADSARLQAVADFNNQISNASEMAHGINSISELVADTVKGLPQWHHLLADLSSITSDHIRIQELRGEYSFEFPFVEINGLSVGDSEMASGEALNKFVEGLELLYGVEDVVLGSTSRISMGDDKWGRQFTMKVTLSLEPIPQQAFVHASSNSQPEGSP